MKAHNYLALNLTLIVCAACGVHSGYNAPASPLLERSYIVPVPASRDSIMFEAQIAAPIYLRDNFDQRVDSAIVGQKQTSTTAYRAFVVPMFRVRQLEDSSAAVRTPSFMPSVYFQRHYLKAVPRENPLPSRTLDLAQLIDRGWRLGWNHHSNGQAGCFRRGYIAPPSGDPDDCVPGPNADTTGIGLNRSNGDFSTTYWSLGGFWRRVNYGASNEESSAVETMVTLQMHQWGGPGDMRREQRDLYGTYRGRADVIGRKRFGGVDWRLELQGELAERTDPRIENWRGHVELSARAPWTLGVGAMVRVTGGQDYYNIGFVNRRSRVLWGIVLDPTKLESLSR
jgi:hypothetical protein